LYYKGINLTNFNDYEIYELVLTSKLPNFPPGFWCQISKDEGSKIALQLLKHLIKIRLKLERDQVINVLSKEFILNNKLWTPCKLYFGRSAIKYLMAAYPNEYKAFEFVNCRIPQSYWCEKENRVDAIKWLIEDKLKWSLEDIREKFNKRILEEHGLATLMSYYSSSFEIINEVYTNKINVWELRMGSVSPNYWKVRENRITAIRWLIKNKLNLSHDEVINNLTLGDFYRNKLSTLICEYYNKSIPNAIIEAFEDEFKPWEFCYHRWNIDDARMATKWLVDKLRRENGKQPSEIDYYDFQNNKLRTVIDKFYNSSPKKAIRDAIGMLY
jgi:hypothetical protein